MTFGGMIGAHDLMAVVEMRGGCGRMTCDETIGECDRMTFVETIGPCGRMKGPYARTMVAEKNEKTIATNLGEMIAGGMITNGNSVLEGTKMSKESVFGTWKRKKCAKDVDGTKMTVETDDQ
jgi:hypothetical protein